MITKFESLDFRKGNNYYIGRFMVDKGSNIMTINLIENVAGSYIKYGMYMLSGYKITILNLSDLKYVRISEPSEWRWENRGDEFEKLIILSADELFKQHPEVCEKLYSKMKEKHVKFPGLVRYAKFVNSLEKSKDLMVLVNANKYNL